MDDTKLRALERQYKLRVKTGCETCRIRRVKCDETKPYCLRCTRTGRKCEGYKHVSPTRDQSPAAAASFRNSSFLVVPQKPPASRCVSRNPSPTISEDPIEKRAFYYFRTHTLPQWTEFFESHLWSEQVLQLSHAEPAIKHGILALSTMHERFEATLRVPTSKAGDYAFVQYMQAVKHSNSLISDYQKGKAPIEKVLMANIIFTCYENLAGNYKAAAMHLRNGLNILIQHQRTASSHRQPGNFMFNITNVLYRFDLQAMTFSDNTSPYEYQPDNPPPCLDIPAAYTSTETARDDLVSLLRCMMWAAGVANVTANAMENPTVIKTFSRMMAAFENWVTAFERYEDKIPEAERNDEKQHAGRTLLKMYSIIASAIGGAGAGLGSEMAWDSFRHDFQRVVELAEKLPVVTKPKKQDPISLSSLPNQWDANPLLPASGCRNGKRSPPRTTPSPPSNATRLRPLAPAPARHVQSPSQAPHTPSPPYYAHSHSSPPSTPSSSSPPTTHPHAQPPTSVSVEKSFAKFQREITATPPTCYCPSIFTPSFELSPIVPLFITATRCRDPYIRRRAIKILLSTRRREGVWDSTGAAKVAMECVRVEEGQDIDGPFEEGGWMPPLTWAADAYGDVGRGGGGSSSPEQYATGMYGDFDPLAPAAAPWQTPYHVDPYTGAPTSSSAYIASSVRGATRRTVAVNCMEDVPEERRVTDTFIAVRMDEGEVDCDFFLKGGMEVRRVAKFSVPMSVCESCLGEFCDRGVHGHGHAGGLVGGVGA